MSKISRLVLKLRRDSKKQEKCKERGHIPDMVSFNPLIMGSQSYEMYRCIVCRAYDVRKKTED